MTRNWKWFVMAVTALAAAGSPAAAQECPSGACNTHSHRPVQVIWSTQESPRCEQTLWECLFPTTEARHGENRCASECVKGDEHPRATHVWVRPHDVRLRCISGIPYWAEECGEPRAATASCACGENCACAKPPTCQC